MIQKTQDVRKKMPNQTREFQFDYIAQKLATLS